MTAKLAETRPGPVRIWLLASRPATLPAAVAPVLAGTAAASWAIPLFDFRPGAFVAALLGALLLQIGTNFANDYADFRSGADNPDRLGPLRVTQAGYVTAGGMRIAIVSAFAAAAGCGIYLIIIAGWPIAVVGAAAILGGLAYTGGPWPYGYHGLGDAFVYLFFGLIAVMGSYYVQVEQLTWEVVAAALPVGMPVTAILVVNNLRDVETDRQSGKRTLAVILGAWVARREYASLMIAPYALVLIFAAAGLMPWAAMETWLALPIALLLTRRVLMGLDGVSLNPVLKQTGQVHLLFGVLLAVSYLW
ncbi:MAG: 1,4-dihydroxy-2-naphthoate polyprenyltransferase [Chloroflexi bacterium]|nr:1,4-dihydroxy-2-naphthoate polyprenyltransferase [Chloroflexota bacterium]